jgi:VanZ family protein
MNPTNLRVLLRAVQLVFFGTLIFTFVAAVMPPHQAPKLFPWDKAEHFAAFYTLTVLAMAAFPRRKLFVIALFLSAFGALIEIVQGLPFVGRDRDFWDWVADTIAITAALAPMACAPWRRNFREPAA